MNGPLPPRDRGDRNTDSGWAPGLQGLLPGLADWSAELRLLAKD